MAVRLSFMALALALGTMAGNAGGARAEPATVVPVIDIESHEGALDIAARASAISSATVMADLSIERHGRAGNVSTHQSRMLNLKAGESGEVARTSVSFSPGDVLEVRVTLREEGRVVGQASLAVGGAASR